MVQLTRFEQRGEDAELRGEPGQRRDAQEAEQEEGQRDYQHGRPGDQAAVGGEVL